MPLRLLERRDGQIPRNGGEIVQELFQRVATLDVVDQCLHRHARTDEDGGTPEDLGIGMDD